MGFAQPVGPSRRAVPLKATALVVATLAMAASAWFTGVAMAHEDKASRAQFAVTTALALVLLVYVLLLLQDLTWDVRRQGRRLVGWGLAGRTAVDLDRLTGAAVRSSDRGSFLVLRDDAGSIMVELPSLRTGLGNDVAAALRSAQESGRVVLPVDVARLFRLPVAPGAPRGGRRSVQLRLEGLGVVLLLCAGIALGLTVG